MDALKLPLLLTPLTYVHVGNAAGPGCAGAVKTANASGQRRALERVEKSLATSPQTSSELPPLLRKLMTDYAATGQPPAYLPESTVEPES